jgi:hypothetical protein
MYRYHYPDMSDSESRVRGFLDAIGVNLNPSTFWNVIRWTFVLDWVINISQWLDQFKTPLLDLNIELLQYCYSVHVSRTIQKHVSNGGQGAIIFNEDAYKRRVINPDYASSIRTSGLNPKEFSLLSALYFSRQS